MSVSRLVVPNVLSYDVQQVAPSLHLVTYFALSFLFYFASLHFPHLAFVLFYFICLFSFDFSLISLLLSPLSLLQYPHPAASLLSTPSSHLSAVLLLRLPPVARLPIQRPLLPLPFSLSCLLPSLSSFYSIAPSPPPLFPISFFPFIGLSSILSHHRIVLSPLYPLSSSPPRLLSSSLPPPIQPSAYFILSNHPLTRRLDVLQWRFFNLSSSSSSLPLFPLDPPPPLLDPPQLHLDDLCPTQSRSLPPLCRFGQLFSKSLELFDLSILRSTRPFVYCTFYTASRQRQVVPGLHNTVTATRTPSFCASVFPLSCACPALCRVLCRVLCPARQASFHRLLTFSSAIACPRPRLSTPASSLPTSAARRSQSLGCGLSNLVLFLIAQVSQVAQVAPFQVLQVPPAS